MREPAARHSVLPFSVAALLALVVLLLACMLTACAEEQGPEVRESVNDYTWAELGELSAMISKAKTDEDADRIIQKHHLVSEDGTLDSSCAKDITLKNGFVTQAQIAGFRHDELSDGSGMAGISFLLTGYPSCSKMSTSQTTAGGWPATNLYDELGSTYAQYLPADLAACIAPVDKATNSTGRTDDVESVETVSEGLWIPSLVEVTGELSANDNAKYAVYNAEGSQYRIFREHGITYNKADGFLVRSNIDEAGTWWLRSPRADRDNRFLVVTATGTAGGSAEINARAGVLFGFCLTDGDEAASKAETATHEPAAYQGTPYEALRQAAENRDATVKLEGNEDNIAKACWQLLLDPDMFYLKALPIVTNRNIEDESLTLYLTYYYDTDEAKRILAQCNKTADAILAKIPASASDYEKALLCHDELIALAAYPDNAESYDPAGNEEFDNHLRRIDGAFVNRQAVCQGYAVAYEYLLDKLGIECDTVVSKDHAWNVVVIDGTPYHVDVTSDDLGASASGTPYASRFFFMVTESDMTAAGYAVNRSQTSCAEATATEWNYYEHNSYLLDAFDAGQVADIFALQLEAGSNLPTVRFSNKEAYEEALAALRARNETVFATLGDNAGEIASNSALKCLSVKMK